MSEPGAINTALKELQEKLNLPSLPHRVECYDISNISGTSAVGSMVVFDNDRFRKEHYRRFRIKTVTGTDDYAMMEEVLRRRFLHNDNKKNDASSIASEKNKSWNLIPDLLIIDGGRGHLRIAQTVLKKLNITGIAVMALAKEKEEIFLPGHTKPIILPDNSPALHLLQRTRDEAHRFAVGYHKIIRQKKSLASQLDEIPGIGDKRKKNLLKKFGSLSGIKRASIEELMQVSGMTHNAAKSIKEHL